MVARRDAVRRALASQSIDALAGGAAGGEAGGEQVAAGGRLPVEHLAGAEHARQRAQHQARRRAPRSARRRRVLMASSIGRGATSISGSALMKRGQRVRVVQLRRASAARAAARHFTPCDAEPALQMRRQAARAARAARLGVHLFRRCDRAADRAAACALACAAIASRSAGRERVDRLPSTPRVGDDELALLREARRRAHRRRDRDRLHRIAGEALAQVLAPAGAIPARSGAHVEAAVARHAAARCRRRARPAAATHAPSEPRRDQLAPPSASTTASASNCTSRRPASRNAARRRASRPQPSQRWRMWNCTATPAARHAGDAARRAAAARPSCRSGTRGPRCRRRCSMPSARAHARTASGPNAVEQRRQRRARVRA